MKPLFVSFVGRMAGQFAQGWVVLSHDTPLAIGVDVQRLAQELELIRGYDKGTLVLIGFQRLEDAT